MFRVTVTNFQSIQNIDLEVTGLTVLTAPSHSGKSSLVRSMDALMTGKFYQEAYMRSGANLSTITLTTPNHVVEFSRKGSSSTYKVDGASFGKIGRKAPEELSTAGFGEVQIAESATDTVTILPQIQSQFDGPYQDTIPPVALTQLLGSFTNLAPYQTAQDKAKKQQAEARREIERIQKERLKTSAIFESLTSYSPEAKQAQFEKVGAIGDYLTLVEGLIPSYQFQAQVLLDLKKTRAIKPPFGQVLYTSVKKLVQGNNTIEVSFTSFLTRSVQLQGLLLAKSNLEKAYPRYAKPVTRIVTSNYSVTQWGASVQGLLAQATALKDTRGALGSKVPQEILRKTTKSIAQDSRNYVYCIDKISKTVGDLGMLQSERDTVAITLSDLQARKHLLADACEQGLCPLCMNSVKPRQKKKTPTPA